MSDSAWCLRAVSKSIAIKAQTAIIYSTILQACGVAFIVVAIWALVS